MGSASLYTSSENLWAVSNTGNFISNPNGPQYIAQTGSQITGTLDSELYKTARISPSSLRYYGLGLKNGIYSVELHFAEIGMVDSHSWKGLGRRIFDVYIQVCWKLPFTLRNFEKLVQETETVFAVRHLCACLMVINARLALGRESSQGLQHKRSSWWIQESLD
jgi:hypothetical protein